MGLSQFCKSYRQRFLGSTDKGSFSLQSKKQVCLMSVLIKIMSVSRAKVRQAYCPL